MDTSKFQAWHGCAAHLQTAPSTYATPIPGHEILIRTHMKAGDREFRAIVTGIEAREGGIYFGWRSDDPRAGSFGAAWRYDNGPKEYGIVAILDLGEAPPPRRLPSWSPRPGDRGYDLMC